MARLESAGSLPAFERAFAETTGSYPFRGAVFAWWSYPPPVRAPDYSLANGEVAPLKDTLAEAAGDPWSLSLPLVEFKTVGGDDPVDVRVAVVGPRRRLGILKVSLAISAAEFEAARTDWRGRFLVLAHVVQQCVCQWREDERPNLGRREVQCLKLAADGLKAKQIASALGIGQQTVQFHLSRAREKLDCSNTVQAVARAAQFGLLPDISPSSAKTVPAEAEN